MAHSYPYMLYIANAKRLVQIRYKAWRFLTAFLIVLIFVPLNGGCMRAYMGHIWGQQWGIHGRIYGHIWGHTWAIWEQQWGMHARIHGHIRGQQWGIHGRIHGPYMGAAMGHACAHTWAIYGGIYGPHGSSNGACIRAYMASPIGRAGRKGTVGNPFPSLVIPAPSLPLPSLPFPVPQRSSS